jgi:hypothetical protein
LELPLETDDIESKEEVIAAAQVDHNPLNKFCKIR